MGLGRDWRALKARHLKGQSDRAVTKSVRNLGSNVCTNRWTEDDVRSFASDSRHLIFTLHSSDRFGNLGLVAFVHATIDGGSAEIVDWVMSCRAMNRRIEFAMEGEVERNLASRGVKKIAATWKRTAKNNPVENLFDAFGFELVESAPGLRRYKRPL